MTIPERSNPNPPTHVEDLGDERRIEKVTRGGWRWLWVWPLAIALVFWWAGWGWGGSGGWLWGAHSRNSAIPAPPGSRTTETLANVGAQQPATSAGAAAGGAGQALNSSMSGPGVPMLTAGDKRAYIGKHFEAKGVPVLRKVDNRVIWIGGKQPTLAVISGNETANQIVPGSTVDAQGTVKKAPPQSEAVRYWALSQQGVDRLENEGAYVQISQMTVPGK